MVTHLIHHVAEKVPDTQASWGESISGSLETINIGHPLLAYETLGSTNDIIKELAIAGAPEGLTVVAGTQSKGRGRQGRPWLSTPGKGVYMSTLIKPKWSVPQVAWLPVIGVVSVTRALESVGLSNLTIKWPNDIMANGKKIGGILVEPRTGRSKIDFAVIGIGINVLHTHEDFSDALQAIATSCAIENVATSCHAVTVALIHELDRWYAGIENGDRSVLFSHWKRLGGSDLLPHIDDHI